MEIKKIMRIGSWSSVVLIALSGCYYDQVLPAKPSVGDVGNVTFSADIIPIFNASCNVTGCHSAGGHKPNLSAANAYSSLINGGYINKTTPESSLLYQWMEGKKGTPMPVSGSNATYNAKVLKWIELGALNN
jgi:hypothetical protein